MRRSARLLVFTLVMSLTVATGAALAGAQPPVPQDEFVPLEQVPPEDQLPAAPLLITAYAAIWVLVLGYLWSLWRRMATVEQELVELSRRAGSESSES